MMKEVYDRRPTPADWIRPDSLTFAEIDNTTGYKFTPFCPQSTHAIEWYLPGTEPREFCPVHNVLLTPGANPLTQQRPN